MAAPFVAPPIPVWIAFPFAGGYANYGGSFQTCQYMKDQHGIVHLRGLLTGPGGSVTVGTLPVGFRPLQNQLMHGVGDYAGGQLPMRLDVTSGGSVNVSAASGVAWGGGFLSLANLRFATT